MNVVWILTCLVGATPVTITCDKVDVNKDTVFCMKDFMERSKVTNQMVQKEKAIAMAPRERCLAITKDIP